MSPFVICLFALVVLALGGILGCLFRLCHIGDDIFGEIRYLRMLEQYQRATPAPQDTKGADHG